MNGVVQFACKSLFSKSQILDCEFQNRVSDIHHMWVRVEWHQRITFLRKVDVKTGHPIPTLQANHFENITDLERYHISSTRSPNTWNFMNFCWFGWMLSERQPKILSTTRIFCREGMHINRTTAEFYNLQNFPSRQPSPCPDPHRQSLQPQQSWQDFWLKNIPNSVKHVSKCGVHWCSTSLRLCIVTSNSDPLL